MGLLTVTSAPASLRRPPRGPRREDSRQWFSSLLLQQSSIPVLQPGCSADVSVLSCLSSAALVVKQAAEQQLQKYWWVPQQWPICPPTPRGRQCLPFSCSHPSIGKLLSRAVPGSAAPSHHATLSEEPHFHPKTRRFRVHMTPSPHLLLPPKPSSDHEWAQPSVSQRLMACTVRLFLQPV